MASPATEYKCTLSPELQKKASDELNEKAEWRQRDIQALREMVVAHKGLKCPTDDAYLLRYLRGKKFDYDRAYRQIISYYTIRGENVENLGNLVPSSIPACLEAGVTAVLPKRDQLGRRMLYFRPGKWDPNKFSINDILKMNLMSLELIIQEEETQVNGVVMIGNMSEVGWLQAKNMERNYMKIMTSLLQEAFPCRFKGMHACNEPSVFSYIFAIVKPFLKEKFRSRLTFHGSDLGSVHKQFDPEVLPAELGGKLDHGDRLAQEWKKRIISEEPFFETLKQHSIELDRHIASGRSGDNAECLIGTYRKLNVD